jgi:hypothetical protein
LYVRVGVCVHGSRNRQPHRGIGCTEPRGKNEDAVNAREGGRIRLLIKRKISRNFEAPLIMCSANEDEDPVQPFVGWPCLLWMKLADSE